MREENGVLLVGFGAGARALAGRLLLLQLRGLEAATLEAAVRLAADRAPPVAMLHSSLAGDPAGIRALCGASPGGALTPVASGPRPDRDSVRAFRKAGVEIALFEPFGDAELRFVLNRAFHHDENLRSEARVPTSLDGTVTSSTGEKRVSVYNLSAGGAYLETLRPTAEGGNITLRLPLPEGEVEVAARVISTNVPGNLKQGNLPIGMGVQFRDVQADACQALERFVRETDERFRI